MNEKIEDGLKEAIKAYYPARKIEDGSEPAFPVPVANATDGRTHDGGLTKRQHTAILLRVPQSGLPWLDEMITESRRDAFAGEALAGLLANPGGPIQANPRCGWGLENCKESDVAGYAYHIADAMIEARRSR